MRMEELLLQQLVQILLQVVLTFHHILNLVDEVDAEYGIFTSLGFQERMKTVYI